MVIYFNTSNVVFSKFLQERTEPLLSVQQKKIVAVVSLALAFLAAGYYLLKHCHFNAQSKVSNSGNIKINSPNIGKDQKEEASKLGLKLEPLALKFENHSSKLFRNSSHVLANMCLALKAFGVNEDFNEKLAVTHSLGQGGREQPDTVRGTFKNALSKDEYGGFQATMDALSEYIADGSNTSLAGPKGKEELEDKQAILKICQDIVVFLKTLDLNS